MGTINGCGTMFYGWNHGDEDSTATKWFTLFYFPVIPLSRSRLKVLTDFENEKFISSPKEVAAALVGCAWGNDIYQIRERLSLDGASILTTYFKAYILLPFLVVWPISLLIACRSVFGAHPEWANSAWATPVIVVVVAITLGNAIAVPMWAIQLARGYRVGLFKKKSG